MRMVVAPRLFRLEQLDIDLERRQTELAGLRRRLQRDAEVEALEARLKECRAQEKTANLQQRTLEGNLTDIEARIKRDHARMYSGQIVDSRELASLEKELQAHRDSRDRVDNELLIAMEGFERAQTEVAELTRELAELRRQHTAGRPALEQQVEDMAENLVGMRAEREELLGQIDPRTLNLYDRLRVSSGHAVSHVAAGVCQWCRVTLPPKDIQHARAGALVTCTNCARILYAG